MSDRSEREGEGERRRDKGMKRAAAGRSHRVMRVQLASLDFLVRSPSGVGTINDATPDAELAAAYADRGCWRGCVTRSLAEDGLIERVGYELSDRPTRPRAPIAIWKVVDRAKARRYMEQRRAVLDATQKKNDSAAGTDESQNTNPPQGDTSNGTAE